MIAAVATSVVLAATSAGTPAPRPATVPALQTWKGSTSGLTWKLTPTTRVFGPRAEARTLTTALSRVGGGPSGQKSRLRLAGGSPAHAAGSGDVLLQRRPGLPREGYTLRIGRQVKIQASTNAGLFYGGRTLLQLAHEPIPWGTATDAPRYAERGLMIDNGRAFFSRAWLAARIRELGRLKLNRLHLHFSDDQGFRIESTSHPEAVTKPALTHADVTALVAVARRNHVRLIPEIDMPGHMTAALRAHPELELRNAAGQRQAGKLDITIPAAQRFALELIDEYLPLFGATTWHMGADEYLGVASTPADYSAYPQLERYADAKFGPSANGKDAVLDFVNIVGAHVRDAGAKMRVWSDGTGGGSATGVDPRTSVEWWDDIHSPAPAELIGAGHQVVNTGWWPLYYVTGGPLRDHRVPVETMYEQWQPWTFDGPISRRFADPSLPPEHELSPREPKQRGAFLAVWNDDPTAPGAQEKAVATGIRPRLRVLAQKTWASPPLTDSYAEFAKLP